MSIEQEDRDAAIEVLRDTRCIATARLERGFAKPVPEEAALMADALIAAGFSRHPVSELFPGTREALNDLPIRME